MSRDRRAGRAIGAALAAAALLLLAACASDRNRPGTLDEYPLLGMVYDEDNQPCSGAWIYVDGRKGPQTDIRGRFVVNGLRRGIHRIEVSKEGVEPLLVPVDFLDRSQVLYLKVVTFAQLLRRVEQTLEARQIGKAEEFILRAERLDDADPQLLYLKAVWQVETGEVRAATGSLEQILLDGHREAMVYLTLADLYQYRLQDLPAATAALEGYLRVQKDPEVQRRLEALQAATAREAAPAGATP